MGEEDFSCRYCGRPIAVPMSTCPWPDCRETIMVICAACRAYTDNQGEFCEHCGEPLVAATFEDVELSVNTQALLVQLAQDQERARLVASGVIARYSDRFFSDHVPEEGVLADLLGVPLTSPSRATAVLFATVAYLVQASYCQLEQDPAAGPEYLWTEASHWDGQMDGPESRMAAQAWQRAPLGDAVRHMIARETNLLLDDPKPDDGLASDEQDLLLDDTPSRVPKALNRLLERLPRRQDRTRGIPHRPAAPAIIELGWETALPKHEEAAACEETRQVLIDFEEADPLRAQYVLDQICEVLDWFERVELDPQARAPGRDAMLSEAIEDETAPCHDKSRVQSSGEDALAGIEDDRAPVEGSNAIVEAHSAAAEDGGTNGEDGGTNLEEDSSATEDGGPDIEDDSLSAEGEGASPPVAPEEESPEEDGL